MKLEGKKIEGEFVWETVDDYDIKDVLLAMLLIIPDDSVLCIEGTSIADEVKVFLFNNQISDPLKIYPGTVFPKPAVFHIPATIENLQQLVVLSEYHAENEICDHLHVYHKGKVLITGYDFSDSPLVLSDHFNEQEIETFCHAIKCKYRRLNSHENS